MIKYYCENAIVYEARLFKVSGGTYMMVYPKLMYQNITHKLNKAGRQTLKTDYRQVPDLVAILLGVELCASIV